MKLFAEWDEYECGDTEHEVGGGVRQDGEGYCHNTSITTFFYPFL